MMPLSLRNARRMAKLANVMHETDDAHLRDAIEWALRLVQHTERYSGQVIVDERIIARSDGYSYLEHQKAHMAGGFMRMALEKHDAFTFEVTDLDPPEPCYRPYQKLLRGTVVVLRPLDLEP